MTRKSKSNSRPSPEKTSPAAATIKQTDQGWARGVLLPALASAILLWAASPPLAWGLLAWIAPLGWLWICARQTPVGGRGYVALWLSGCLFWLLVLHGIRLAYWPLTFGWLAMSLYLAVYTPAFVVATRTMYWSWKWPLVIAAPVAWLGLELIRSYLLTGYAANSLAHTQVHFPSVIQLSDQLGSGGVGFVMMTVSAALTTALLMWHDAPRRHSPPSPQLSTPQTSQPKSQPNRRKANDWNLVWGPVWAGTLLACTLGYGWWRLYQADRMQADQAPLLRVLLLQENTPSIFDNYSSERNQQSWDAYLELARQAAVEHVDQPPLDLVVWPESTFTANEPWVEADIANGLPPELQSEQVDEGRLLNFRDQMAQALRFKAQLVLAAIRHPARARLAPHTHTTADDSDEATKDSEPVGVARTDSLKRPYLLVGNDVMVYNSERLRRYNSALWIGPDALLLDRYSKMHLVMFGEYIPLGPLLQWLRDMVGLAGMDAGEEAKSFPIDDVRVSPSICFESMMPRVINRQIRSLKARGETPDVLINITNDSWFRGSSMLDHHLACSLLCAVENRRPLLVAANTGLSASIDSSGRVLQVSERLQAEAIVAEPKADGRWGLTQAVGYPLSWLCALLTVVALVATARRQRT